MRSENAKEVFSGKEIDVGTKRIVETGKYVVSGSGCDGQLWG